MTFLQAMLVYAFIAIEELNNVRLKFVGGAKSVNSTTVLNAKGIKQTYVL